MPLTDTPSVLLLDPPTGKDVTVPRLVAKDGGTCPAGTKQVLVSVVGPTPEWQALLVIWSTDGYFGGPVVVEAGGTSFGALAANNNLPLVAGKYQMIAECDDANFLAVATYVANVWFTDTSNYVTSDPATTTLPVAFNAGVAPVPANTVELGQSLTLTATLDQATAVGTIQFRQRSGSDAPLAAGAATAVTNGSASVAVSGLPLGVYYFTADFTPADPKKFTASATTSETAYAIVPPAPPTPPDSATISTGLSGGVAKAGISLSCATSGSFTGASSTGYRWRRDFVLIDGATSQSYTPTAEDVGHQLQCEATGTKTVASTGVTSGRISQGAEVQS